MPTSLTPIHRYRASRLAWFAVGARSADQLRRHMAKSGVTLAGQKLRSKAEIKLLHRFYTDYARACTALPDRSRSTLKSKAFRLGITRPLRVWSDEDLKRLKAPYRQGMSIQES